MHHALASPKASGVKVLEAKHKDKVTSGPIRVCKKEAYLPHGKAIEDEQGQEAGD